MCNLETRIIYKKLLRKICTEKVKIKRVRDLPCESPYQYRRRVQNNNTCYPHIMVRRLTDPGFLDKAGQFKKLYNDCSDHLKELICLAHELGHHLSKDHEIDSLYDKIRIENGSATFCEKHRILREEKMAWKQAKKILKQLGFTQWESFKSEKSKGLRSYRMSIRIKFFEKFSSL